MARGGRLAMSTALAFSMSVKVTGANQNLLSIDNEGVKKYF